MADYRQDCINPGCGYTGFSGHSDCCPYSPRHSQWVQREQFRKQAEAKGYKKSGEYWECQVCFAFIGNIDRHREKCVN